MADRITVSGIVETVPRRATTTASLDVATFRLRALRDGSSRVHPPAAESPGAFVVTVLGPLAASIDDRVRPGDLLVVAGTLHVRALADDSGVVAELTADAVGLDIGRRRAPAAPGEGDGERAVPS